MIKSQKHLLPYIRPNNGRNYTADTLYGRPLVSASGIPAKYQMSNTQMTVRYSFGPFYGVILLSFICVWHRYWRLLINIGFWQVHVNSAFKIKMLKPFETERKMRLIHYSSLCGTPLYLVENRGLISHPWPRKSAEPRICKNEFIIEVKSVLLEVGNFPNSWEC